MNTTTAETFAEARKKYKKQGQAVQVVKRLLQNRTAIVGMVVVGIIILIAIFAPLLTPYNPNTLDPSNAFAPMSLAHPLGCDNLGRDTLARIMYGARWSLALGLCAAGFGAVIGLVFGTIAGYYGGWVDSLIMRILDVLQAIPGNLLSIVIATVLGSGFINTVLALSIGGISGITRMLRARILSERSAEYLEAAASINCTTTRIMFGHLLPNTVSPVIVNITMGIGATIMQAAGLSYIGLGMPTSTPEWGAMLSSSRGFVSSYPLLLLWPGLAIAITVLAVNMIGDGLRDAMDPKLKR
ncbi:MAG: ABC transporter permease [Clostridiales bacterium]|nr:ABC transporter permease [Clostridiales bacterium]